MSLEPWSVKGSTPTIEDTSELMLFIPSEALPADKNKTINGTDLKIYTENITLHSGIRRGLALSIASGTTFDVAEGEAILVDKDPNPLLTVVTQITKAAQLGITDTNLGEPLSHIFMDAAGTITVETDPPQTIADVFDKIYLGALLHFSSVIVSVVPDLIPAHGSSATEILDLVFGGGTKLQGSILTGNADLTLDISAGIVRQVGRGLRVNANAPNAIETPAFTPVLQADFFKIFVDAGGEVVTDNTDNLLDPTMINLDGLGTLTSVGGGNFSIIRVFQAGVTNDLLFYYGTESFATIDAAVNAIEPTWVEHPDTKTISPIAKIFIQGNTTDIAAGVASGSVIIQAISSRTQL